MKIRESELRRYYVVSDISKNLSFRLCDLRIFESVELAKEVAVGRFDIVSASILFKKDIEVKILEDGVFLIIDIL